MPEVMVELTPAELDTQLKSTGEQAVQKYKDELIEKGFNPDNIEKDFKDAQKQPQTTATVTKEADTFNIGLQALVMAKARAEGRSPMAIVKEFSNENPEQARSLVQSMNKTYKSHGSSKLETFDYDLKTLEMSSLLDGVGSNGGYDTEVAPLLRANGVVFNLQGAKYKTLVNGTYTKRIITDGISGEWVGETTSPTEDKQQYSEFTLSAKKAAALTTISKTYIRLSDKNIQKETQDELLAGLTETVDTAFFTGSGSLYQPKGLNNVTGFKTNAATSSATAIETGQDLYTLKAKMLEANIKMLNPYWIGTEYQKLAYASKYTANGQIMNYSKDLETRGVLAGANYMSSNYVSTDNSVLWLIDASELIIGTGYGVIIDIDENYDFSGGKIGLRAEIALDWGFQRAAAVGKLTSASNHL